MNTMIYWISTGLTALAMLFSSYAYLVQPKMKSAFHDFGFPGYFRIELAVAKIIGVLLLLLPVGSQLKEWAYAGFVIVFISAFIAHVAMKDTLGKSVMPLVFLMLLLVSYFSFKGML